MKTHDKLAIDLRVVKNMILCMMAFIFVCGCGVKGDPLPPLKPAELGRGKPTYKRPRSQMWNKNNKEELNIEKTVKEEEESE